MGFQEVVDPRRFSRDQAAPVTRVLRKGILVGQMGGEAPEADERIADFVEDTAGKLAD